VHYEIRLFGNSKALQSSDRSLLAEGVDQVRMAQSPHEIRSAMSGKKPWPSAALEVRHALGSSPPLLLCQ
jgi:hypothetical protein